MKGKISYLVIGVSLLVMATGFFVFWQTRQGKIDLPVLALNSRGNKLGQEAIAFINANLLPPGTTASLVEVTNQGNVYKVKIKIGEEEPEIYVSKDGKFLFTTAFELKPQAPQNPNPTQSQAPPKSDRPEIKLFVMSYCPYGLQMEKVYLPVYNLLKDKADFGIYFVDYIMHGKPELDENLKQYCLQEQNKDEFAKYLDCFAKTGQTDSCLSQTSFDQNKLASCIATTDEQFKINSQYQDKSTWVSGQFPKFDIHQALNQQYRVQGSPAVIINDQEVTGERSPEAFKNLICQAFSNPPQECSQALSTDIPEAGIGSGTTDNSAGANCAQ